MSCRPVVGRWTRRSAVSVSLKTFGSRGIGYPGSFGREKAWIGGIGCWASLASFPGGWGWTSSGMGFPPWWSTMESCFSSGEGNCWGFGGRCSRPVVLDVLLLNSTRNGYSLAMERVTLKNAKDGALMRTFIHGVPDTPD